MRKPVFAQLVALALALVAGAAAADPPATAWLVTNDALGDGRDRWRSASVYLGHLVPLPGSDDWLEHRVLAELIAPANLVRPDPRDRRHAGILSVGLHRHLALARAELRLGADLVAVGPSTGLGRLQEAAHDLLGQRGIDTGLHRLPDRLLPTLSAEAGLPVALGPAAELRPFAELRLGDEHLLRIGADLSLGLSPGGAPRLRDPVTGHRLVAQPLPGAGRPYLLLGADLAAVARSAWLPAGGGADARDRRLRLRAGLGWQGPRLSAFYGLTWLSPEVERQGEGQLLGSVRLRWKF